jgi:hypothetical protein
MAAGAVPAVKANATPLLLAGRELFTGAGTAGWARVDRSDGELKHRFA